MAGLRAQFGIASMSTARISWHEETRDECHGTQVGPDRAIGEHRDEIALARQAFRVLHQEGCFVIPNPWDIGSARYLQHLGFRALATTSAGFAFSQGLPDSDVAVSRDRSLAHIGEIATAVDLPVNADFASGYGIEPQDVADSVSRCVATGVAGLSIEDATGDPSAAALRSVVCGRT